MLSNVLVRCLSYFADYFICCNNLLIAVAESCEMFVLWFCLGFNKSWRRGEIPLISKKNPCVGILFWFLVYGVGEVHKPAMYRQG